MKLKEIVPQNHHNSQNKECDSADRLITPCESFQHLAVRFVDMPGLKLPKLGSNAMFGVA